MSRKALLATLIIVVATNVLTLVLVAANRTDNPEALLQVTERELRLPPDGGDNSGVMLSLAWRVPYDARPAALRETSAPELPWFDRDKLISVGFDCSVPPGDPEAEVHYRRVASGRRPVYAVLELEGEAWKIAVKQVEADPSTRSYAAALPRLMVADVGRDAGALRARYPDRARYVVVAANARAVFAKADEHKQTPARVWGEVVEITPSLVHVPRDLRARLDAIVGESRPERSAPRQLLRHEPRYRVTIAWGSSLEPWLVDITKL